MENIKSCDADAFLTANRLGQGNRGAEAREITEQMDAFSGLSNRQRTESGPRRKVVINSGISWINLVRPS